jgi:hypothetical protein
MVFVVLWCAFWGAFAAIMGGSTATAIFVGAASIVVPLLVLLAIAWTDWWLNRRKVRKARKAYAKRREEAQKRAHAGEWYRDEH